MYDDEEEEEEEEDDHAHNNNSNGHLDHDDVYDDGDPNDSLDEDMDDELLDKISSSPSIEDGKQSWPVRVDSLPSHQSSGLCAAPTRGIFLSTPQLDFSPIPRSFPTKGIKNGQSMQLEERIRDLSEPMDVSIAPVSQLIPLSSQVPYAGHATMTESSSLENVNRHCLPKDDPFLDDEEDEDWLEDMRHYEDNSI